MRAYSWSGHCRSRFEKNFRWSADLDPIRVSSNQPMTVDEEYGEDEQQHRLLIQSDDRRVKPFAAQKFIKRACNQWDIFYKNNRTNFFKDRHWCESEFPELLRANVRIFEIGCGVGNFILPQLERNPSCFVYGCDFSPRAIQMLRDNPAYDMQRSLAFVYDMTAVDSYRPTNGAGEAKEVRLLDLIAPNSVDIVTCLFMMSALTPEQMPACVRNIRSVLKPGTGVVILRDYAVLDMAQIRFHQQSDPKLIDQNLYLRQDGTLSYFFTEEFLCDLFKNEGFECIEVEFVRRTIVNRKEELLMKRRWIQAKFRLPNNRN